MTRHSLGYLLSERAKAQKQFVPSVAPQQNDVASEQYLLTNNKQEIIEAIPDGVVNRDATPDNSEQVDTLQHGEHPTQQ